MIIALIWQQRRARAFCPSAPPRFAHSRQYAPCTARFNDAAARNTCTDIVALALQTCPAPRPHAVAFAGSQTSSGLPRVREARRHQEEPPCVLN